ncbi:class I SAM-dependent methyltransferase [Chloroflexota bacterium]
MTITSSASEEGWSKDKIQDPTYSDKFKKLPEIINSWVKGYFPLSGKRILDFGCGEGTTALGIALQFSPLAAIGIDINNEYLQCPTLAQREIRLSNLPQNLSFQQIESGQVGSFNSKFDLIYSWSVFEHINRRLIKQIVTSLRESIKQTGLLFIQIAPLYYSSDGGHLGEFGIPPWGHLLEQEDNIQSIIFSNGVKALELRQSVWSCYQSLNKITADELIECVQEGGFKLVREYRTRDDHIPPERLLSIFHLDILTTNQIVALFKPDN